MWLDEVLKSLDDLLDGTKAIKISTGVSGAKIIQVVKAP